jgi:outer membrane translocation and assembly module TamA
VFRIGGAVYLDYGRAWGGPMRNTGDSGWLANVGFGLRVLSDRASFGKIYHIDLAFPINNDDPNVESPQFLVKSRTYF